MYVKNTKKIAEKLVSFADSLEFYNKFSEDVTEGRKISTPETELTEFENGEM